MCLDNNLKYIKDDICKRICIMCDNALMKRFKELPSLGNVYIDKKLKTYNVPFSMRSSNKSIRTISRGSKIDTGKKDTIRFFIWWKDITKDEYINTVDIDLSAILYNENFKYINHVSYTNLRAGNAYHSGDITSAPDGAAEFVDISKKKCLDANISYLIMSVYAFTTHPLCKVQDVLQGLWLDKSPRGEKFLNLKLVIIKQVMLE